MSQPTFRLTVTPPQPLTIVGLVVGGYFPLTLLRGHTVLLDQNILIFLKSMSGSKRSDAEANRYWLESLDHPNIKINLGLYAMEGSAGRALSFGEFYAEHEVACTVIRSVLPHAEVMLYPPEIRRNVYEVQVELQTRYEAECSFLKEISALVSERPSDDRIRKIERQVIETARSFGLTGHSLVLLASLACLYEAKDGATPSCARHVLKPKKTYDSAQAHNAISDLRSLELLASTSALGVERVALCTADRGLAAFWCALEVGNPEWTSPRSFRFDFNVSKSLFPRLPETDVPRLLEELKR